jgi:2'-5' RNA ligase
MPEDEVRLFIAVDIPLKLKNDLLALQERLALERWDAVRWVRPDGFHITVKFLGETPARKVPAIEQALSAVATRTRTFSLTLGGIGFFPNGANANHIYVGLSGDFAALHNLQRATEAALHALGYPQEGKAFKPHITLGRLRKEATHEQRAEAVQRALALHLGTLGSYSAEGLLLMRSTLARGGSIYEETYFAPFRQVGDMV